MDLPQPPLDSPKRLAIMVLLERHGDLIFSELYKSLRLSRGSVDSHLRTLEEYNYVYREQRFINTTSRVMVCPTPAGLRGLKHAKSIWYNLIHPDKDT
jgi:DNA-binding MarR family transcriptional regulator